ncbi:MAG: hypothetical protein EXS01_06865 [Phycisphaerales bacterium]|nr:hypothetical protein [Phycisphaerales bacterium]
MNSFSEVPARGQRRGSGSLIRRICLLVLVALTACHTDGEQVSRTPATSQIGWPRTARTLGGDRVTLSSLQVDEWRSAILFAKCAAVVQPHGAALGLVGTINIRASAALNRSDRMVVLTGITIPAMRFPTDEAGIVPIREALEQTLVGATLCVPLDDLLASMLVSAFDETARLSAESPPLEVRLSELLRGEKAEFAPIVAGQLEGCVNASSPLLRTDGGACYTLDAGNWFRAESLADGAWSWVDPATLSPEFKDIPESSQWAGALAFVPETAPYREAQQIASLPPAPTAPVHGSQAWWNPWEGCWWSPGESAAERIARDAAPMNAAGRDSLAAAPLAPDSSSENLFVGLDGRVYALRGSAWYRSTPDGGWTELTERRSTARVLTDSQQARVAAKTRRAQYELWRTAQRQRDASSPATASQEAIAMQAARPSSDGFRHATLRPD